MKRTASRSDLTTLGVPQSCRSVLPARRSGIPGPAKQWGQADASTTLVIFEGPADPLHIERLRYVVAFSFVFAQLSEGEAIRTSGDEEVARNT